MKQYRRAIVPALIVLALAAAGPAVGASEETGPDRRTEASREAWQKLSERLDGTLQGLEQLQKEVDSTTGEDLIIIRSRLRDRALELLRELDQASTQIVEDEAKGLDVSDRRARVESLVAKLPRPFRRHIDTLFATLVQLKKRRAAVPDDQKAAIEEHIVTINEELDEDLGAYLDLIVVMDRLGLDTTQEKAYLSDVTARRAEKLSGRISLARKQWVALRKRASVDSNDTALAGQLQASRLRLDRYVSSLQSTIRIMDALGLDTTTYKQQLFQITGDVTAGLLDPAVLRGLAHQWRQRASDWVAANGLRVTLRVVVFCLILLVSWVLSRISRKLVKRSLQTRRLQVSQLLERTTVSWTGKLVLFIGLLVALSQLGVEVAPLLAGLGVAGFIVGFALQDTLSNFASGIMILIYHPYDVGDLIEAAGAFGTVSDMSLVSTTILTLDRQTLVVPNNKIWGDVIKNVTAERLRRVDMEFGISYDDDIEHAERVLREIVEGHEKILATPEPVIKLHRLGDSSVDFIVRPWVKTADYWEVYWDVTRAVKVRFDAEGISIPYPQQDVHIHQSPPTKDAE